MKNISSNFLEEGFLDSSDLPKECTIIKRRPLMPMVFAGGKFLLKSEEPLFEES